VSVRLVVVGLGVQGHKRVRVAGQSVVATVDPVAVGATYTALEQVPVGD
jgi:scyllo-inositol 2-dehydrogenase (NADP+)